MAARDAMRRWGLPCDALNTARQGSLLARALLRGLLCETTGLAPLACKFETEPSGRPIARIEGADRVPSIAISHSSKWVACAVTADGRIGIDVEAHRRGRDIAGIASLAFGERERRDVERNGAGAFYRIWTTREALAKARGQGLAEAADGIDRVSGLSGPGGRWRRVAGEEWWLGIATPVDGLAMALAFQRAAPANPGRDRASLTTAPGAGPDRGRFLQGQRRRPRIDDPKLYLLDVKLRAAPAVR